MVQLALAALVMMPAGGAQQFDLEALWEQLRSAGFTVEIRSSVRVISRGEATLYVHSSSSSGMSVARRYAWGNPRRVVDYDPTLPVENWSGRIGFDGTVTIYRDIPLEYRSIAEAAEMIAVAFTDAQMFEKAFFGTAK